MVVALYGENQGYALDITAVYPFHPDGDTMTGNARSAQGHPQGQWSRRGRGAHVGSSDVRAGPCRN